MQVIDKSYGLPFNRIPVFLAPMSGVTDAPFRKQAEKFGATATVTEMVAGEELQIGTRDVSQRLKRSNTSKPYIVQLVGREVEPMHFGACFAREEGADVIDINMGCPSRRVTGGLSGSALMKDLDKAEEIISAVLQGAQSVPVTLKMRLGWDWSSINAPELAQLAERLGVKLLTVHGRTRQDFYEGSADWSAIADVKRAVNIPVIANGDIVDTKSARCALSNSGADGVMIGRGATGLPWKLRYIEDALNDTPEYQEPSYEEQVESLLEQTSDSIELYGERVGIRVVRKHIAAAFDHWGGAIGHQNKGSEYTKKIACSSENFSDLANTLNHYRFNQMERELA